MRIVLFRLSVVDFGGNGVVIVVDESGVVWLYVVDPGEVAVDVRG